MTYNGAMIKNVKDKTA